jgi:hypothetical protein
MTDAELSRWWPDLGSVVTSLRSINQGAVADLLVRAVEGGSTGGEIHDHVRFLLKEHAALRKDLSEEGAFAWKCALRGR